MERLKKYIEHYYEKELISTELTEDETKELEFLEKTLKEINISNLISILECNKKDFFLLCLRGINPKEPFSTLKEKVDKLDNRLFSGNVHYEMIVANNFIAEISRNDCDYLVISMPFMDNYDEEDEIVSLAKDKGQLDNIIELHNILRKYIGNSESQRVLFFDLAETYASNLFLVLSGIASINDVSIGISCEKKNVDVNSNMISSNPNFDMDLIADIRRMPKVLPKPKPLNSPIEITEEDCKDKGLQRAIRGLLKTSSLDIFYKDAIKRLDYLKNLTIARQRENIKVIRKKEKILSHILSFEGKPIEITQSFLVSLVDEKIKYLVLKRIAKHNLEYHANTMNELKKEKELSELERLFKKSCFSIDDLTDEEKKNLITYGNLENIEKILNLFNESNLKTYNNIPIYDILLLSKPSIVSIILKLLQAGFISESFVIKSKEIFVSEIDESIKDVISVKEPKFDVMVNNVNLLRDERYDTFTISEKDKSILLMDYDYLVDSIKLISHYNLDYSKSNDFDLLKNHSLISIADRFIELGLGDFIKTHPDLISQKSIIILNRMELYKRLGVPLVIDGRLNPNITADEFKYGKNIIADDDINEYIHNSVNRYLDEKCFKVLRENTDYGEFEDSISELKEFEENDIEYNICGIIISKNKVLRNYYALSNSDESIDRKAIIFNSLIYGSILEDEQLEMISGILNKKLKKLKIE